MKIIGIRPSSFPGSNNERSPFDVSVSQLLTNRFNVHSGLKTAAAVFGGWRNVQRRDIFLLDRAEIRSDFVYFKNF